MEALLIPLGLSGAVVATSIAVQYCLKTIRHSRLKGLELRPNCLLTRYPIAFLSAPKSVFRLFGHWNELPNFLREHGYEVMVIEPPPRARARAGARANFARATLEALEELPSKCHLIADSSNRDVLEILAQTRHPQIASLTWVSSQKPQPKIPASLKITVEDLRPSGLAIETVDLSSSASKLRPQGFSSWLARFAASTLLVAHNFISAFSFGSRTKRVDGIETADLAVGSRAWLLESQFLDHAISLAERDAQWCD